MAGDDDFFALYRDPRWQKRKGDILRRDDHTCQTCGDKKTTLHAHHRRYIRGHKPWEYDDADLVTLCEECHADVTDALRLIKLQAGRLDRANVRSVLGFALGVELCACLDGSPMPDVPDDIRAAAERDSMVYTAAAVAMGLDTRTAHQVMDRSGGDLVALVRAASDRMDKVLRRSAPVDHDDGGTVAR